MSKNQSPIRRKFLKTISVGGLTLLAGCSSGNTDNGDDNTEQNSDNTESSTSVFSDYYTEGSDFVVELNSENADSVEEIILHYNEGSPRDHPRQSVQGISTVRFPLETSGKNDPSEGTWEIEAVGADGTIETTEYEAERSLSLEKVGTKGQSDKFENTDGLTTGDLQFSITNDGDIPTTAYTFELTSSFNSGGEESGSDSVIGLGEGNPEPEISPDETLVFRWDGALCFDVQKDENAEEWFNQTAQAGLIANAGVTQDSWTYPLSVEFGSNIEKQGFFECIENTTVSERETQ